METAVVGTTVIGGGDGDEGVVRRGRAREREGQEVEGRRGEGERGRRDGLAALPSIMTQ